MPGIDLAGAVERVGQGVTALGLGDEVFGFAAGTLAEFVCVPVENLARRPVKLTFAQAAAVPECGMTALQGLRDQGRVRAGSGSPYSGRRAAWAHSRCRSRRPSVPR